MLRARPSSFPRRDKYTYKPVVFSRNTILIRESDGTVDKQVICVPSEAVRAQDLRIPRDREASIMSAGKAKDAARTKEKPSHPVPAIVPRPA